MARLEERAERHHADELRAAQELARSEAKVARGQAKVARHADELRAAQELARSQAEVARLRAELEARTAREGLVATFTPDRVSGDVNDFY